MKWILILTIILTGVVSPLLSQDKIYTRSNDTIDCRITRVTRNALFYEFDTNGIRSPGKISMEEVISYLVTATSTRPKATHSDVPQPFPGMRLSLNGGAGYLVGNSEKAEESLIGSGIPEDKARQYYENIRTGIYGSSDLHLMLNQSIGVGLRYKFYYTGESVEGFFDPGDAVYHFYSDYTENIYVNFVGASVLTSESLGADNKFRINCAMAGGMTFYRNEASFYQGNFLVTGSTFGLDAGLGLEYFINPFLSVGTEFSALLGVLKKVKITDGTNTETVEFDDKEYYENLYRIELSVGLRFYLWNK